MKTLKSLFALSVLLIANSAFAGNTPVNTGDKGCCTVSSNVALIEMIEADAAAEADEPLFMVNSTNTGLLEMIEADAAAEADEPLMIAGSASTGLMEMIEADAAAEADEELIAVGSANAWLVEMIEADAAAEANIGLMEGVDCRSGSSDELIRMIEQNATTEVEEIIL